VTDVELEELLEEGRVGGTDLEDPRTEAGGAIEQE
jgi:hypothetical protein